MSVWPGARCRSVCPSICGIRYTVLVCPALRTPCPPHLPRPVSVSHLSLITCLSIHPIIYLCVCPSILSILCMNQSVYQSIHLSIYPFCVYPFYVSILCINQSINQSVNQSILPITESVRLSVCQPSLHPPIAAPDLCVHPLRICYVHTRPRPTGQRPLGSRLPTSTRLCPALG